MKWHKFLEKYLKKAERSRFPAMAAPPELTVLPVLRAHLCAKCRSAVVCPTNALADALNAALSECAQMLGLQLEILNLPETQRGKLRFPGAENRRARTLDRVLSGNYDILTGSASAFTGPAPLPGESASARIDLHPGMSLPPEQLVEKLLLLDYDDEYETTVPGEFSRRGGIIDLYSPAHEFPCRIEYFGKRSDYG